MTASGTKVYSGIYKARCTALSGNEITAYVPQMFGDVKITTDSAIGAYPTPGTFGYVVFEGGDPAFPIWAGSLAALGQTSLGAQGPQGPQGATGAAGAAGASAGYYGAFHDELIQTATAVNTPYSMKLRSTDGANGFSISSNSRITAANAGIYNLQFSAQLDKSSGASAHIRIWLRKNGVDVPNTSSKVAVQGTDAELVPSWNWVVPLSANDYLEIMWSTSDTNIQLITEAATAFSPFVPSVIATIQEVAHTLQGPQGATGVGIATGGTTNQFLVKNSATNFDTAWSSSLVANSANVTAATASSVPVTINGVASQTAYLTEWKNSSGGLLAAISPIGQMLFTGASAFAVGLYADSGGPVVGWGVTTSFDAYGRIDVESGMLRIKSNFSGTKIVRNDDGVVVAVQGVSGQTNDLQQWQNSAGTVLARVTSSGEVRAALIDGGSA